MVSYYITLSLFETQMKKLKTTVDVIITLWVRMFIKGDLTLKALN